MRECNVVVFDLDGVLLDRAGRGVRGAGVRLLLEAVTKARVYIVTGRVEGDRGVVLSLLRDVGVNPGFIKRMLMRPYGDKRGEVDLKLYLLSKVMEMEGCILELHDDNPRVLEAARRLVSNALVLHYNEVCEVVRGKSILHGCI